MATKLTNLEENPKLGTVSSPSSNHNSMVRNPQIAAVVIGWHHCEFPVNASKKA